MAEHISYNETSIANLEVAQDMGKSDYFLIQPQDFNNKAKILPFRNMIIGLDNVSFAKTITDNSTKINELSAAVLSLSGHTVPATNITGIIQPHQYYIGKKSITGNNIANNTVAIDNLEPNIQQVLITGIPLSGVDSNSKTNVTLDRYDQQYIDYVIGSGFKTVDYDSGNPIGNNDKDWYRRTTYYRLYRSGWLEQGGTFLTRSYDDVETVLSFDIAFKDKNFIFICSTIYDDVITSSEYKTTDNTWYDIPQNREPNGVKLNRCVSVSWQACGIIDANKYTEYAKIDFTNDNLDVNYNNDYKFP